MIAGTKVGWLSQQRGACLLPVPREAGGEWERHRRRERPHG